MLVWGEDEVVGLGGGVVGVGIGGEGVGVGMGGEGVSVGTGMGERV